MVIDFQLLLIIWVIAMPGAIAVILIVFSNEIHDYAKYLSNEDMLGGGDYIKNIVFSTNYVYIIRFCGIISLLMSVLGFVALIKYYNISL